MVFSAELEADRLLYLARIQCNVQKLRCALPEHRGVHSRAHRRLHLPAPALEQQQTVQLSSTIKTGLLLYMCMDNIIIINKNTCDQTACSTLQKASAVPVPGTCIKGHNKSCRSDIHTTSLEWPFKHEHQLIIFASQKDTMLFMTFYG